MRQGLSCDKNNILRITAHVRGAKYSQLLQIYFDRNMNSPSVSFPMQFNQNVIFSLFHFYPICFLWIKEPHTHTHTPYLWKRLNGKQSLQSTTILKNNFVTIKYCIDTQFSVFLRCRLKA